MRTEEKHLTGSCQDRTAKVEATAALRDDFAANPVFLVIKSDGHGRGGKELGRGRREKIQVAIPDAKLALT
jgi:hypothetical protein